MTSRRVIEAHAAGVSAMFAALDTRTPDEREAAQLEQLRERYARGELTDAQLELETGRVLGLPDPPPEPPRSTGAMVHAAVIAAGVVGLLIKWRRPGSRWVL